MENTWYIIANPTSGNGIVQRKWKSIITSLDKNNLIYQFTFSEYEHHEQELVYRALEKGFKKFICVGGDGTLHHIVNGIMTQKFIDSSLIKVAVIPMGTGNDWVKTYKIPKNIKKSITIIKKENIIKQDIGELITLNTGEKNYFNNIAGLGFDAFVVKNVIKYKKFGAFAYLLGTLSTFIHYKKCILKIEFNDKKIYSKALLALVGICNYCGGGMQLTKKGSSTDGLFDISIAKNFNFLSVLKNIVKFYNGKIIEHKEVETYKASSIKIETNDDTNFIQADGELVGTGGFKANIIPKAISFIVP
jgi:YegS/Rv2252/BmrU family lipid kinase